MAGKIHPYLKASLNGDPYNNGAPERIRTSDLCLRRAALYPAELRVLKAAESRT